MLFLKEVLQYFIVLMVPDIYFVCLVAIDKKMNVCFMLVFLQECPVLLNTGRGSCWRLIGGYRRVKVLIR